MRPLSPIKYIFRNLTKVAMTMIAVAIGVFIIYFYSLLSITTEMVSKSGVDMLKEYSIVYSKNGKEIDKTLIKNLKNDNNTKLIIPLGYDLGVLRYHRGFGSTTKSILNLREEDITKFMESINMKLLEGTLPKNKKNEILIPIEYAKQNNLKVGSIIDSKNKFVNLKNGGSITVCGITEGNITMISSDIEEERLFESGFLYSTKDGSEDRAKQIKQDYNKELLIYICSEEYKNMMQTFDSMNMFNLVLTAFLIIVLCINLANLKHINFINRSSEFFILHAIGYKKSQLIKRFWKENLITCFISYLIGIGSAFLIVGILNICLFDGQGKTILMWNLSGLAYALLIPIFVSFFSIIPCLTSKYEKSINCGI